MTLRQRSPLKRSTQMKRSAFKPKMPKADNDNKPRSTIKPKARKKREWHDKGKLDACRGQSCYLAVPDVCLGEAGRDTVVPCHSNSSEHGKGMGRKADDIYTVPGCFACHAWLDQGPAGKILKQAVWEAAYRRWSAYRDKEAA